MINLTNFNKTKESIHIFINCYYILTVFYVNLCNISNITKISTTKKPKIICQKYVLHFFSLAV